MIRAAVFVVSLNHFSFMRLIGMWAPSHSADVTIGFTANHYTARRPDNDVMVCVKVLTGYLDTFITLEIKTHKGEISIHE